MTVAEASQSFWGPLAAKQPSKDFVAAVQAQKLLATDSTGTERGIVVMSIASEFTFHGAGLWQLFLSNLQNITFTSRSRGADNLARHLLAMVMTLPNGTADSCDAVSRPYGARCVTIHSPMFTHENYGYKSPPFYSLSFAKTLTILDALTLGVDVFFLDGDQVFFRNPLPYLLARDVDVLVTGDCMARRDDEPADTFPPINSNIGLLYFRATPAVTRAVANWLMHMVERAYRGRPTLDQTSFTGAMQWLSQDVGARVMSVAMLRGELFPHWCMGPCGCNTTGVEMHTLGSTPGRPPGGACDPAMVRQWYHYHVPCCGDMNSKANTLRELLQMYRGMVGEVGSLSAPFEVA